MTTVALPSYLGTQAFAHLVGFLKWVIAFFNVPSTILNAMFISYHCHLFRGHSFEFNSVTLTNWYEFQIMVLLIHIKFVIIKGLRIRTFKIANLYATEVQKEYEWTSETLQIILTTVVRIHVTNNGTLTLWIIGPRRRFPVTLSHYKIKSWTNAKTCITWPFKSRFLLCMKG